MSKFLLALIAALVQVSAADARPVRQQPMVTKIETREVAKSNAPAEKMAALKGPLWSGRLSTAGARANPILASQVTFAKSTIFHRVFLYGSDLQYSSMGEEGGMLLQSLAVGHVTAKFQVIGDRLQLMAEERYRYESDINIPLRLLHEWPILRQTADEITVDVKSASPALSSVFGSQNPARTSWVRSVEFVAQGEYLLLETSVELADGKIAEFMESLFPRETLVNATQKPIYDDPAFEPFFGRFGFLSSALWISTPEGRTKTAVAQRFATPAVGKTIDWYVTPNVPAEYIPAIQSGIEGWNRYSQKMWGRDFIKFKGVLPNGVKIGDPRYNVVNWDSVVNANAAYESQAADPETGLQSHSLIYLPYAWIKIGQDFWKNGRLTEDRTASLKSALDQIQFLGKSVRVPCFHEGALGAINIEMRDTPESFGKELLRQTLFHEVGHALGLGHNFKGSLEWDPDKPGSLFSSSIMDYNQFSVEGGAYRDPTSSDGPILEYDRQLISKLYNEGKDIADTDPVVPFCDDAAADSTAGGIDPLCLRYDAGQEPSEYLVRTFDLLQNPSARLGKLKSLAGAAEESLKTLNDPAQVASEDDVSQALLEFRGQLQALVQFYFASGAHGFSYTLSSRLPSLLVFRADTLPAGADPVVIRNRVAMTMDQFMKLESFSPATHSAFAKIGDQVATWIARTAWYASADATARTSREDAAKKLAAEALSDSEAALIPLVRARQLQALARSSTAPFFFAGFVDYEARALDWLEAVLVNGLPSGETYTVGEKVAAAQTLATFMPMMRAVEMKLRARALVESDLQVVTSAGERESLRALLNLL